MSTLLDYLNLIDQDATALEAHLDDPQQAMDAYGLSAAEQQALLSGDKAAIANLTGADEDDLRVIVFVAPHSP